MPANVSDTPDESDAPTVCQCRFAPVRTHINNIRKYIYCVTELNFFPSSGFRPWFLQDCELAERVSQLPMYKVFMKLLYALAGLSPCYCFSGHKKRAHQSSLTGIPVFVYSVLDARPPHFALLLQNDRSRPLRRRSSSGYFKSIPSLYASSPFSLLSFPEHPSS